MGCILVICAIWFETKKWVKIFETNNDCHVYIQYGDVFFVDEVDNPNERRTIVIPINRCFDTIIDNDLINDCSITKNILKFLENTEFSY